MAYTILIIDDEKSTNEELALSLRKERYKTLSAYDGPSGLAMCEMYFPDLILLDVNIPVMDGITVCKEIRKFSSVPIIMLTACKTEEDKVLGFEAGADDYITKPYSMREVSARIKAAIRRTTKCDGLPETTETKIHRGTVTFGELEMDFDKYDIRKNGVSMELSVREFDLLRLLVQMPGRIYSRDSLLENVWGYEYSGDVRIVDVTIRRLREKIEPNPGVPRYILTKRTIGYYFNSFKDID